MDEGLSGTPFAVVPEWVLYAPISDRAKLLYAVLQRHVNKASGLAFPGQARLGKLLGCSEDSIQRAMAELEGIAAVVVHRGHGAARATNSYTLAVEDPQHRSVAALAVAQHRTGAASNTAPLRPEREEVEREHLLTPSASGDAPPAPAAEELQLEGMPAPQQLPRVPRARDVLWDYLDLHFGKPSNDRERGRRRQALRMVRQSLAADPALPVTDSGWQLDQLQLRCERARVLWGVKGLEYTEMAIATNWQLLGKLPPPSDKLTAEQVFQQAVSEGLQL